MTDKHKHFFVPYAYNDIKSTKNYTTPPIGTNTRSGTTVQPNGSTTSETSTLQKPFNPIGSSFSSGQYLKNYSNNMAHFHDRIDNIQENKKKEENTVFSNNKESAFELRSSVPVNYTKKPNVQFLRNTTFNPKAQGLYSGQYNFNDNWNQSPNTESQDNKPSFNKLAYSPKFDNYLKNNDYDKDWRNQKFKYEKQISTKQTKDIKQIKSTKLIKDSKDIKEYKDYKDFKEFKQIKQTKQTKVQPESKPIPYSPASISLKSPSSPQNDQKVPSKNRSMIKQFSIGKSLGSGKFAEVFLAKHIASNFILVLKRLSKQKIKEYQMQSQVIQQIKIHAFLNHPNIVQFYGVFSDQKYIYLMLEYLESGTLFDYIGDKYYLEEKEAAFFLRQICGAVKYLHSKGIAHRDIKPQNIIISYGLVKLCDFGWSARVLTTRKTYCGTFSYAPPEIHQRKAYDQTVDLWCIGVLTYELLTNQVPFDHKDRKIAMQIITNVDMNKIQFPKNISIRARDFIESLLRKNPEERLKAFQMLEHPFLKQYQEES